MKGLGQRGPFSRIFSSMDYLLGKIGNWCENIAIVATRQGYKDLCILVPDWINAIFPDEFFS